MARRRIGQASKALASRGLDQALFEAITAQLKAKAMQVKTGALVDAATANFVQKAMPKICCRA